MVRAQRRRGDEDVIPVKNILPFEAAIEVDVSFDLTLVETLYRLPLAVASVHPEARAVGDDLKRRGRLHHRSRRVIQVAAFAHHRDHALLIEPTRDRASVLHHLLDLQAILSKTMTILIEFLHVFGHQQNTTCHASFLRERCVSALAVSRLLRE